MPPTDKPLPVTIQAAKQFVFRSKRVAGFSNSTQSAFNTDAGTLVSDPNQYVFWDGFHPTTKVHHIAADFIFTPGEG